MDPKTTVKEAVEKHQLWLTTDGNDGERFDLSGKNLQGANLKGCDLSKADLSGVKFREALLSDASLREVGFIRKPHIDERPDHLKSVYSRRDAYIRNKDRSR